MKRSVLLILCCLLAIPAIFAQIDYFGGAQPAGDNSRQGVSQAVMNNLPVEEAYIGAQQPEGYVYNIQGTGTREWPGCEFCAIPEGETDIPDEGTDVTNGGCNYTPVIYSAIQIGDVVCGRGNGYTVGGMPYRDTDWYQFTLAEAKTLYWSGVANFNCVFYILGYYNTGDCPYVATLAAVTPIVGEMGIASLALTPGTYVCFAAPNGFGTDPSLDGDYMATFTDTYPGTPETWCLKCSDCATAEGEPPLVDDIGDVTNYGCNGVEFEPDRPPIFSSIYLKQVICGSAEQYLYNDLNFRDTDWYRMVLHSTTTVHYSGIANFDFLMFIIQGPCGGYISWGSLALPAGVQGSLVRTLPPGEYYFWAGPSNWSTDNEGNYQILVTTEAPGDYSTWCRYMVPVSDWALYLGLGLILVFAIFRFRWFI